LIKFRFYKYYLIIPLIIFLFIGSLLIYTERPWVDEAILASSSINLVENGFLGVTNMITEGTKLEGLDEYTYWQPPFYYILEALVFKIFGIGIFQARFLSLFFGLIGLIAVYFILKKSIKINYIIFIGLLILSTDHYYLLSSSNARMDIISNSLTLCAIAVYLINRENRFKIAIILSNTFICLSGLTHPNGVIGFVSLIFLILYLDYKKINFTVILLAFVPYVIGLISWGIYIMQDYRLFLRIFCANITNENRNLYTLIYQEFAGRYFSSYWAKGGDSIRDYIILLIWIFPIIFYYVNFISGPFMLRKNKSEKFVWWILLIYFLMLMLVMGNKTAKYLNWILVFFIINSLFVFYKLNKKKILRYIGISCMILIVISSALIAYSEIRRDDYSKLFLSDLEQFDENHYNGGKIYGSAEISFFYEFSDDIIQDDKYLGYYTEIIPDYIIIEKRYKSFIKNLEATDPEIYSYIDNILNHKFEKIFKGNYYTFYKKI
jgi:4-amino-4-deoxy-L-arabinose transferase-like glycosyltransferase